MIGDLIGGGTRSARAPAAAEPVKVAEAPKAADTSKPSAAASAKPAAEPKAAESKAAEPKAAAAPAQAGQGAGDQSDEVLKAVNAWASAWAKKDVPGYLAHYAKDFKTPKGEPRSEWEHGRKTRISAPKKIEVGIEAPKVSVSGVDSASVTFRQVYRSDVVKADGKWLIREERVN